ncbi:MAG TPA: hypothetical protein VLL97_13740 [Acidobacteriota bacterium]|nr:hypothetical protein [Acidobacteriota bacterium]
MTEHSKHQEKQPEIPDMNKRPVFPHPPWMMGVVLILAVLAIIAGLTNPIWLVFGMPCILVLLVFIYVRLITAVRPKNDRTGDTG